uniref:AT-rich interaction domain 5A n=1 Tax=Spermophilus dauricus TaxID=99837 RepID=A0A8C9UQT3_SPEDA
MAPAPPVKGKRKQSEEGEALEPPASPKPDGAQSRSQSPIQMELTSGRSTRRWRSWGPTSW